MEEVYTCICGVQRWLLYGTQIECVGCGNRYHIVRAGRKYPRLAALLDPRVFNQDRYARLIRILPKDQYEGGTAPGAREAALHERRGIERLARDIGVRLREDATPDEDQVLRRAFRRAVGRMIERLPADLQKRENVPTADDLESQFKKRGHQ